MDGLALRDGDRLRVLLANMTAEPQTVRVPGWAGAVRATVLDAGNALHAMQQPEAYRAAAPTVVETDGGSLSLALAPYGIARLDGRAGDSPGDSR